jgi:hypothetical protein
VEGLNAWGTCVDFQRVLCCVEFYVVSVSGDLQNFKDSNNK